MFEPNKFGGVGKKSSIEGAGTLLQEPVPCGNASRRSAFREEADLGKFSYIARDMVRFLRNIDLAEL